MNTTEQQHIADWLGSGSINIFGRPFAGKDSQGQRLAAIFGGNLLGGGEIMRGSDMPDRIKSEMRAGKLIPSVDYVAIVLPYLSRPEFANAPMILSSVGRWHGEENGVLDALQASNHPLKAVVYLRLEESDVMDRWRDHENRKDRSERHDDSELILETRFKEFRDKTLPVIEFYRNKGLLIEIDGTQSRDDVTAEIIKQLHKFASRALASQ